MPEAERVKPRSLYIDEAIQFSLESRWADALAVNQAIIERYGPDEDTYNRSGKALAELGRLQEALDSYGQALQISPTNVIAQKNSRKLAAQLESPGRVGGGGRPVMADLFTEEPGKSALTVLAAPRGGVGGGVAPGDAVELEADNGQLHASAATGLSLGDVDPKISRRLVPLMLSGNRYAAAVARVEDDRIEIVIREMFQAPENSRKSSFPLSRSARRDDFRPYAKESLIASRGIDAEPLIDDDDDERLGVTGDDPETELDGMETVDDAVEGGPAATDDAAADEDEDIRPEDQY